MTMYVSIGRQIHFPPFWTHEKGRKDKEPEETSWVTKPVANSCKKPHHKTATPLGGGHRDASCFLWCDAAVGNHVIFYAATMPRVKAVTEMY